MYFTQYSQVGAAARSPIFICVQSRHTRQCATIFHANKVRGSNAALCCADQVVSQKPNDAIAYKTGLLPVASPTNAVNPEARCPRPTPCEKISITKAPPRGKRTRWAALLLCVLCMAFGFCIQCLTMRQSPRFQGFHAPRPQSGVPNPCSASESGSAPRTRSGAAYPSVCPSPCR